MSFELTIKADSPDAFAQQLVQAAFLVAPNLAERFAPPKVPVETAAPAEEPKKPRGRKAAENVAKKETKATNDAANSDATAEQSDQQGGSADAGEPGAVRQEADAAAGAAAEKSEAPEPVSEVEAAPAAMSIDELRQFTINEYLNKVTDSLPKRKDLYKELLDQFEVEAINKLPAEKIAAFKAAVDEKIVEAMKGAS